MSRASSMDGRGVHTEFWFKNLTEGDHQGDLDVNGRIILKCTLQKQDMWMCTGFIWFVLTLCSFRFDKYDLYVLYICRTVYICILLMYYNMTNPVSMYLIYGKINE
jgi:hypothetical protein